MIGGPDTDVMVFQMLIGFRWIDNDGIFRDSEKDAYDGD